MDTSSREALRFLKSTRSVLAVLLAFAMPVIAAGCNNPTGSDSDGGSNGGGNGSTSELAGTAWLAEDEQDRDDDGDPDDRVIAFGSQGNFAGIWYNQQSTDAADPFTDTPMDATSTEKLTGDRGTYTVIGGDDVEVTITEVYGTQWQDAPPTTYTRSFSISGDTITFDNGSQLTRVSLP